MILLTNWRGYGHCKTCNARAQEKCKGRFRLRPCRRRESYDRYCHRYATLLTEHLGYTVLAVDIPRIEQEIKNGNP